MLVLRCTRKLLRELGHQSGVVDDGPFGSWFANILRINRRKCLLFTHSETLLSVFVGGVRKPDINRLPLTLLENLQIVLDAEGLGDWTSKALMLPGSQSVIASTNSRSVLGSMNDLVFQAEVAVSHRYSLHDVVPISQRLNRVPMGAIGYQYPIDAFRSWAAEVSG